MDRGLLIRRIEAELSKAEASRGSGREGRARVCARRAAGLVALAYYGRGEDPRDTTNAYNLLKRVQLDMCLSQAVRGAAARLTTRVTPGGRLPHVEDPLADARALIKELLEPVGEHEG